MGRIIVALALASSLLVAHASAQTWNMYDSFKQYYTLPYSTSFESDPKIAVSLFGTTLDVPLDTGSRGMILTQNLLPANATIPAGVPGSIFYWSSGRLFSGHWVTTTLTFPTAVPHGSAPATATATVPVLIVQSITCEKPPEGRTWPNACAHPGRTEPTTHDCDTHGSNFGIGIDRTGNGTEPLGNQYNQQYNPFLNLAAMRAGTMWPGFVLNLHELDIGLTAADTGAGFAFGKLLPTGLAQVPGSPPDWQPTVGQVALNGDLYPPGQGVVDLGVSDMLLTLPGAPTTGHPADGIALSAYLLGLPGTVGYSFVTGTTTAPAPSSVNWTPWQPVQWSDPTLAETLVNTGRRAVAAFNYLYDGGNGFIGLQLNGRTSADKHAFLSPGISAIGTIDVPPGFTTDLPIWLRATADIEAHGTATFQGAGSGPGGLNVKGGGSVELDCLGGYAGDIAVWSGHLTVAPPVHAHIWHSSAATVTVLSHPMSCD
jgi:hypothetical protein